MIVSTPMHYTTVYDVETANSCVWPAITFGAAFFLTLLGLLLVSGRIPALKAFVEPRRLPLYALLAFAVIGPALLNANAYYANGMLRTAIRDRTAHIVEGRAERFEAGPYWDYADESFCVQQHCFWYRNDASKGGFNRTASHGGPIRENLPVRVTYVANRIARLEVGAP